jgi:SOS-response transcriptional repressor LexA
MDSDVLRQVGMLLRVLRLKAGVDQALLAARLGVSQPTISRYEAGLSQPAPAQARLWATLCREALPSAQRAQAEEAEQALLSYFAAASPAATAQALRAVGQAERALVLDVESAHIAIPYFADVAAGTGEAQEPRMEPRARLEVPAYLLARDPGCYALRVSGESMAPLLLDGDMVVISPAAELADGCVVAAWIEPDGDVVKLYHPLPGGGVVLQPANPAFPPLVLGMEGGRSGRIWGRVVFQQRELYQARGIIIAYLTNVICSRHSSQPETKHATSSLWPGVIPRGMSSSASRSR